MRAHSAALCTTSRFLRRLDSDGFGGDEAGRLRREVIREGGCEEEARSGLPSGLPGCREAPEWPDEREDVRRPPHFQRPRPRRTRPLLRRRSSAASPRGRSDLPQDPCGDRATPPAPPSAPPFPAEDQGRAGHGSGMPWLGVSTPGGGGEDLESLVYSKCGPRVSRSASPGSIFVKTAASQTLRIRPRPIEFKSAYLAR